MDMEQTSKALAAKTQSSAHVEWRKFEEHFIAEFQRARMPRPLVFGADYGTSNQSVTVYEMLRQRPMNKPDALAAMTRCASHPTQTAIKAAWVEPVSNAKPFVAGLMRAKA